MKPVFQRTLKNRISCTGIGLHTGVAVSLTLHPAPVDSGIVFQRSDVSAGISRIPARWDRVRAGTLCTTIGNDFGTQVMTIEHLMAALAGCGIDNAVVEVNGPEVPVMDGSAAPFVLLLECAGIATQDAPRRFLRVLKTVEVVDGDRSMRLSPSDEFRVDFEIDFASAAIARQTRTFHGAELSFKEEIARARTFGFAEEVSMLRANGFARGGTLENAVVVDGNTVLNPGGLRFEDEFVRHKLLDVIGDLYLAGPALANVTCVRSGHTLSHRVLRALFADKSAWCMDSLEDEAEAVAVPRPRKAAAAAAAR